MGVRAGQGYGATKPKRLECPACGKKGVTQWKATAHGLVRGCQYCQASWGEAGWELAMKLNAMPTQDISMLGAWSVNAARLVPRGTVEWISGPLGFAGSVEGKSVASVHKSGGNQWIARVEGWQWHVTYDMGVARMNQIPGDKIKMTPAKAFAKSKDAKDEIQRILAPATKA